MNKRFIFFILLLFNITLSAQTKSAADKKYVPVIVSSGKTADAFVPAGWKIIAQAKGDLNSDSFADEAMVIEKTDPRNLKKNTSNIGESDLNFNPRILLVLFKDKTSDQYQLALQNKSFIPQANSEENSCLSDPLNSEEGMKIKNGLLLLNLENNDNCGGNYGANDNYTFRYQQKRFELIGFDRQEVYKVPNKVNTYSVNFSTRKMSTTNLRYDNEEEEETNPKKVWSKFNMPQLMNLETLTAQSAEDILLNIGRLSYKY